MNTEYLPRQLDIEDAIRALEAAEASGDMDAIRDRFFEAKEIAEAQIEEPKQLVVPKENFESFVDKCMRNPQMRKKLEKAYGRFLAGKRPPIISRGRRNAKGRDLRIVDIEVPKDAEAISYDPKTVALETWRREQAAEVAIRRAVANNVQRDIWRMRGGAA